MGEKLMRMRPSDNVNVSSRKKKYSRPGLPAEAGIPTDGVSNRGRTGDLQSHNLAL